MSPKEFRRGTICLFGWALIAYAAAGISAEEKNTGKCGPIYNLGIAKKLVASLEGKGYGAKYQSKTYGSYGALELRYFDVHYWPNKDPAPFEFHVLGPFNLNTATKSRDDKRKNGFQAERDRIGLKDEWMVYFWK